MNKKRLLRYGDVITILAKAKVYGQNKETKVSISESKNM